MWPFYLIPAFPAGRTNDFPKPKTQKISCGISAGIPAGSITICHPILRLWLQNIWFHPPYKLLKFCCLRLLRSYTLKFLLPVLHTYQFSENFPSNMALFGTTCLLKFRKFFLQHAKSVFSRQKSVQIIRSTLFFVLNSSAFFNIF